MSQNPIKPFDGPPRLQEEYRGDYVPGFVDTVFGPHIVAPDSPYVAACGRNRLYFLDTRHDSERAQYIETQIERATVPKEDGCISIDEFTATAQVKDSSGETVFVFDPVFARVFFARGINKRNPSLELLEVWAVDECTLFYDLDAVVAGKRETDDGDGDDEGTVQASA